MYISGVLIGKDNSHAVVRQAWSGDKYVVSLKNLQFEKYRNGTYVKYGKLYSVRVQDVQNLKIQRALEVCKVDGRLYWKAYGNNKFCNEL